jgi:hypothetical protein
MPPSHHQWVTGIGTPDSRDRCYAPLSSHTPGRSGGDSTSLESQSRIRRQADIEPPRRTDDATSAAPETQSGRYALREKPKLREPDPTFRRWVHVRADVTGVKRGHINVLDDARRCRGHTHATPVSKRWIALKLKLDLCTKQTHRILNVKRRDTEATEMRRQTRFIELDPIPVKVSAERHDPIFCPLRSVYAGRTSTSAPTETVTQTGGFPRAPIGSSGATRPGRSRGSSDSLACLTKALRMQARTRLAAWLRGGGVA